MKPSRNLDKISSEKGVPSMPKNADDVIVRVEKRPHVSINGLAGALPGILLSMRQTQNGISSVIDIIGREDGMLLLHCADTEDKQTSGQTEPFAESMGFLRHSPTLVNKIRDVGARILNGKDDAYASPVQEEEVNVIWNQVQQAGLAMHTRDGGPIHAASCTRKVGQGI
jgi:hypothetical protein